MKTVDLKKTVYDICNTYPEAIKIIESLGFTDIVKPGMLATAGRFMTLPKGALLKKIDLNHIKQVFREHGFDVIE